MAINNFLEQVSEKYAIFSVSVYIQKAQKSWFWEGQSSSFSEEVLAEILYRASLVPKKTPY